MFAVLYTNALFHPHVWRPFSNLIPRTRRAGDESQSFVISIDYVITFRSNVSCYSYYSSFFLFFFFVLLLLLILDEYFSFNRTKLHFVFLFVVENWTRHRFISDNSYSTRRWNCSVIFFHLKYWKSNNRSKSCLISNAFPLDKESRFAIIAVTNNAVETSIN